MGCGITHGSGCDEREIAANRACERRHQRQGQYHRLPHASFFLATALPHDRAGMCDLRSDRIRILRECDGGGVMRSRPLGIARLLGSRGGTERGANYAA